MGNLVSVPFQNNTNFNTGPLSGTQNILNIQPVIPVNVNKDWNIITRTIMPLIWQPASLPGQGDTFGLGDIQLSAFLSPAEPGPGGLIWGAGAIVQMPTNTSDMLGNKNWGLVRLQCVEAGERQPLGLRRAVQQYLVVVQRQPGWALQQFLAAALPELQLPQRDVPDDGTDHHRELGGCQQSGSADWGGIGKIFHWASCR
ncbi:MAG: hypothetical protein IPF39_07650 [Comamonadaceae bacterium]|uniref:hypothetical protein n=1 Tax=Candidatus Skiveiella danica TaxID=3386177 RepID=UPI0039091482|nr:hypothetical protein [Comamonadaceae bacterium]